MPSVLKPWLYAMLALDLSVLVAHVAMGTAADGTLTFFDVTRDGGLAEVVGYAKLALVIGMLGSRAFRLKDWSFTVWTALCTTLLLDDIVGVHEQMGVAIARGLGLPRFLLHLRGRDVGEIIYLAGVSSVTLLVLALAWRRASRNVRRANLDLVLAAGVVAMCGIGFDALHEGWRSPRAPREFLALLEDYGELVAMTGMVAAAHAASASGLSRPAAWVRVRERVLDALPAPRAA
ncbi:MAG: hypothetical protein IPK85_15020 [Gemmatimonadetes bacterium]|nr:hypothetical protein [Gemmatimonadota bacterium]